jgi:hypothetical protein
MAMSLQRVAITILALAGTAASAQDIEFVSPLRAAAPAELGVQTLAWDQAAFDALRAGDTFAMRDFVLADGRTVSLNLQRFEVLAPDAKMIIAGAAGERESARPDVILLRGSVEGAPESMVFLGLSPLGSNGFIQTPEQTWVLSTRPPHENSPPVIYDPASLADGTIQMHPFRCGNEDLPFGGIQGLLNITGNGGALRGASGVESGGADNPCRVVRIAVESDWEYSSRVFASNLEAAEAYMTTVFGAVSEIFRSEIDVGLQVVWTRVWEENDDPYTATTVNQRLNEVREHWNENMGEVERNLVHLLSGLTSGAGGIAYMGVLCNQNLGYAVSGYMWGSFPYPLQHNHSQNHDIIVIAHELGHNFNAPHTHEITPTIDQCGIGGCGSSHLGTIMSYCHVCPGGNGNIHLSLHPRIINEFITPYLNAITCTILSTPASIVSQPLSKSAMQGTTVEFTVQAAGSGPITYRWYRNGLLLENGGRISGATTSKLTISQAQVPDSGSYTVVVSNACSDVTSSVANLSVIQPCYANCDKSTTPPILNILDFVCFINQFSYALGLPEPQQVVNYANCDASTTSPVLNVNDFQCFLANFAAGCN